MKAPAKKSFGQHFLRDASVAKRMVKAIDFESIDVLVEVGPGHGALTQEIVKALPTSRLILIEADRDLISELQEKFPQAQIIQADAAKVKFEEIVSGTWTLIGNLPYYAANPIIMNAMTSPAPPKRLVVMVQKEVADRMLAKPGKMSLLSVAVQLYATPKRLFNVKPGAFQPPPKVTSSVIELDLESGLQRARLKGKKRERIIALAKQGFRSRRKQLHRNLAEAGVATSQEIKQALQSIGQKPTARAQELSVEDWIAFAQGSFGVFRS
ncbi:ribosomal RNA small subunit methyltransferase A [Patescibacteria group bacterium]|nr:ribosomal RNA small subunit methyltransferase A [Patescibacteria group bacterium]